MTHDELLAACDQAQATYDRKRAYVERCVRYLDDCPDGDPRKAEAEQRVHRALSDMHAAERAAGEAADALLEYEDAESLMGYTPGEDARPRPHAGRERAMMATGHEVRMYADITRIANALERVAGTLEAPKAAAPRVDLQTMTAEELVRTIQAALAELHGRAA